jgi:alginate O-acetyltransferase complex protein AlgI
MGVNLSLLDVGFVLILIGLGLSRVFWPQKYYSFLLAASSAVVVGLASPKTCLIITALTVLYLYPVHRLMRNAIDKGRRDQVSRVWLPLSVGGLVALLVLFKVYKHFTVPWLGGPWLRPEILALVGFSYFIFRAISFMHIQAITNIDERSPWGVLAYTLFPPTITSGPIQKFQDFRQQLTAPLPVTRSLVWAAGYRITRGYFRKLVLAFLLNQAATKLLDMAQLTVFTSTLAVISLYLYFYFDFAGYSDIAIGFGLLMGIKVPENFRKPFLATNVSEFWRNWHITLVDWFRDHVFIPLGGMQGSRLRAAAVAFLIMVLCGMWHGVTLTFLAWGIWHGLLLFAEAVSGSKPVPPAFRKGPKYWGRILWTNARVALGGILFLPSTASMFKVIYGFFRW